MGGHIQSFRDLDAWGEGHKLVLQIHDLIQTFPKHEQYGLTNQIWRAVVSITSNIAEGFRRETYKEKIRFYSISLSSLSEVQNQLLIARDVHYTSPKTFTLIANQTVTVAKLLNGLIRASKQRMI